MSDTVLAIIELDNFPQIVANRAAWIAKLYGSELHLLLSDPSLRFLRDNFIVSNAAKEVAREIKVAQKRLLAELEEVAVASHGITVSSSVVHDRPAHLAIIERALDIEPRFIVKGTQFRSRAERATFTFTDWQLIRKLNAPLWLVKPNQWQKKPVIVAAVDPTNPYDKAA
ncbi:MAG: universal stress protein, partial [Gammaproteobacteria bacterium]|nr:universal stress protein [Gammaproteobacteria bacterium]